MIDLVNVKKTYVSDKQSIEALKGVNLHVDKADIFGIIGYSGAGKSTLIRCINLLEKPDSGKVVINGNEITKLGENELRKTRQKIGMIFQHFNLLKSSTIFENVAFPIAHSGISKKAIKEKVEGLLELVGLSDKALAYPSQLSGGQKQRVAIARALANDPTVLLSDEATSALDPQTTNSILSLLSDLNKKLGLTIVLITHEMDVIKEICNKVAVLDGGVIVEQGAPIDIFVHAEHPTTKKFIDNIFQIDKINNLLAVSNKSDSPEVVAHLLFTGETADNAYISIISRKFDIDVSVVYGNIEIVQSQPIGSLFVAFNGDSQKVSDAIKYLKSEKVFVTIIKQNSAEFIKEVV